MIDDGGDPAPAVRGADAGEHSTLAQVLGRAFSNDPALRWWVPDDQQWDRNAHRFFEAYLRSVSSHGVILTTPELGGAALWTPPGPKTSMLGDTLRMFWVLAVVARSRAPLAVRSLSFTEQMRPKESFWCLDCIGTDPSQQGKGIGSALLRPMLERCDEEHSPVFLETAQPSNLGFYHRLGFSVVGEFGLPMGGPQVWQMLRKP